MRPAAGLLVLAIAAALLPVPNTVVERLYASRMFPAIQIVLTSLSNQVPFALFDVLVAAVGGWFLVGTARDVVTARQKGWRRSAARIGTRAVVIAAGSYLVFLLTWGLNYRRVPLAEKLQFDSGRVSTDAAVALAQTTVDRINALFEPAHREGWAPRGSVDPALADAFARAQQDLRRTALAVPGRPKWTLFDPYFLRAAVSGMTDPYFLETLVASDLLPFERPFVIAHEWSHLAGIADEGDANFAGWLTCLRGQASHQYSGWLFLYGEAVSALDPMRARAAGAALGEGPRADLRAIRERYQQHVSPEVSRAGWLVYDRYLKANQIEHGAASYADVVRLILGTEFEDGWTPVFR